MTAPLLACRANILRYDGDHGLAQALDRQRYPHESIFEQYADVEALARGVEALAAYDQQAAALLACYGLALAARAWAGRPSDSKRAALIQAGEQLRQAHSWPILVLTLEQCLAHADLAIMAGDDAQQAVVDFVDQRLRQADRAAERCGRRAAELLDNDDHILVVGWDDPACLWMLYIACVEQGKPIQLYAANPPAGQNPQLALVQAHAIGAPITLLDDQALTHHMASGSITLAVVAAGPLVALDGSIGASAAHQLAAHAKSYAIPFYALAPAGPDIHASIGVHLPDADLTPPELISAIVTDRGIYRPSMISRYHSDNDGPLDVIPLV